MPDSLFCRLSASVGMRAMLALVVCAVVIVWDLAHRGLPTPMARAVMPLVSADFSQPPQRKGQGSIPMPYNTPAAHSSSLLALPASHADALMAFWFAGTRESAPDIGIVASSFERNLQRWRPARFVVNRFGLGQDLGFGVRRLGNPVAWMDAQGRMHLFVVATGLGGWAASRIVQLRQSQAGQSLDELSFEVERVLPLSWWWNTSFLVRAAPLPLQDGGMLLPVYFELGLKYPVSLRFDASGGFKGMVRMSDRKRILQPTVLMQTETTWLALMRDQNPQGHIAVAQTQDGGAHWQDLPDLALVNPDASVAAMALAPGQLWLVHNSSVQSRNVLDLSQSQDGQSWQSMQRLAQGKGTDEFSYPAMAWADDSLWVSYTDQRQRISWQRFAWPKP